MPFKKKSCLLLPVELFSKAFFLAYSLDTLTEPYNFQETHLTVICNEMISSTIIEGDELINIQDNNELYETVFGILYETHSLTLHTNSTQLH